MELIIVVLVILVLLVVFIYNNLNSAKHRVEKSFATIDTYLEERYDDMKLLMQEADKFLGKEVNMQIDIAAVRSGLANFKNASINDKVNLENQMRRFYATSEAYPELKSSPLFINMSNETIRDNEQLTAAKKQYNKNATAYNVKITSFPTNLIAGMFGFNEKMELLLLSEEKRNKLQDVDSFYLNEMSPNSTTNNNNKEE